MRVSNQNQFFVCPRNPDEQQLVIYGMGEYFSVREELRSSINFSKKLQDFFEVVILEGGLFVHWDEERQTLTLSDLIKEASQLIE
jgi:hypothetical protein